MSNQIFMRVNEVAEELGVSVPYAYKLIRQMNEELAKTGCITSSGRVNRLRGAAPGGQDAALHRLHGRGERGGE